MTEALNLSITNAVIDAVRRCFFLPDAIITGETRFSRDLALDSLDMVELAMALEDRFNLEFPDDTFDRFDGIADVVAYLSRYFFHDVSAQALAEAA